MAPFRTVKLSVPKWDITLYIRDMSLSEIQRHVVDWGNKGEPWAEAALVGVRRSAPRPPGARFAVGMDGSTAGSISAGCVEADLREHMLAALGSTPRADPRIVTYGISDEAALGVGLACGGEIDVLIRCHEPGEPVWARLPALLAAAACSQARGALLTGLSPGILGLQRLLPSEGSPVGTWGDAALDRMVPGLTEDLLAREGSEELDLGSGHRVFVDRILPPRRLLIVGATPVAASLAAVAPGVGYRATVVDPRPALAESPAFDGIEVLIGWPDDLLEESGLDAWTDVAVLAHDDRIDLVALEAALKAGCRYVGLLGGRRTQGLRREALIAAGWSADEVERIRGPIGLEIGASTPAEIAASILAEMIAVRRLGRDPV